MSISKAGGVITSVLIVLAMACASIPLAEGAFRVLGDEPSVDLQGMYAQFTNGNYKLAPSVDTGARFAAGQLNVYTDSLGLRCDKARRFAVNPGSALDVLVLGDSQGVGNGVNFEHTIAGSLAIEADKHGVRVANASVGGHSLASQLEVAKWLVTAQRVKVANFLIFVTPAMIEESDKLNAAAVGPDGRLYGAPPHWRVRLRLWTKTHLVIYSRIRDAARNAGIGPDSAEASSAVLQFYTQGNHQEQNENRLLAIVAKVCDFARQHGAAVQLVYVPLTVEADFAPMKDAAAKSGVTLDEDVPFKICSAVATQLSIPLHTLKPILKELNSRGEVLNVKGDFHYSAVLSEACGRELWSQLSVADK
jgi:hypothetical protein